LDLKTLFLKPRSCQFCKKNKEISKFFKMPAITLVSSPESIRWSACKKNGVKALKRSNSGQRKLKSVLKVNVKAKH